MEEALVRLIQSTLPGGTGLIPLPEATPEKSQCKLALHPDMTGLHPLGKTQGLQDLQEVLSRYSRLVPGLFVEVDKVMVTRIVQHPQGNRFKGLATGHLSLAVIYDALPDYTTEKLDVKDTPPFVKPVRIPVTIHVQISDSEVTYMAWMFSVVQLLSSPARLRPKGNNVLERFWKLTEEVSAKLVDIALRKTVDGAVWGRLLSPVAAML